MPECTNLTFQGFYLSECSLRREVNRLPGKIRIGIRDFGLTPDTEQVAVNYKIELLNSAEEVSFLVYQALFLIDHSDSFFKRFGTILKENKDELSPEIASLLISMIQYSFPYIRSALSALTNDLGGQINLPLIDCVTILNGPIEFTKQES